MHDFLNQKALKALDSLDFEYAQNCFFRNARSNPSHETYNNLGIYLINEGLLLQNGEYRNADILGWCYLMKAKECGTSVKNSMAIATAIEHIISTKNKNRFSLCTYTFAYDLLEHVPNTQISYEIEYNKLRFLFLSDPQNPTLPKELERLVQKYPTNESCRLLLNVLCQLEWFDDCEKNMQMYHACLDDDDCLVYYYLCQKYECILPLFESIYQSYSLSKPELAMLIDALIRLKCFDQASMYVEKEIERDRERIEATTGKRASVNFKQILSSERYRKKLISSYQPTVPFAGVCCYFGCPIHPEYKAF